MRPTANHDQRDDSEDCNTSVTTKDCNIFVTIKNILAEIYRRRSGYVQPCNTFTTTTTTTTTTTKISRNNSVTNEASFLINEVYDLLTSVDIAEVYRGNLPRQTSQLLRYLTLRQGSVTIHSPNLIHNEYRSVFGVQAIFNNRSELHRVMKNLRSQGLVRYSKMRPFKGGRKYGLWSADWATNGDVQQAIEEHNLYLEADETEIAAIDEPMPQANREHLERLLAMPETPEAQKERIRRQLGQDQEETK